MNLTLSSPFSFVAQYEEINSIKIPERANNKPIQTRLGNWKLWFFLTFIILNIPKNNETKIKLDNLLSEINASTFLLYK